VPNVFNNVLPQNEYVDLDAVISQYELLDPSKADKIISEWKAALEEIHVHYGTTEQQIHETLTDTRAVLEIFNIDIEEDYGREQFSKSLQTTNHSSQMYLQFKCPVEGHLKTLRQLQALLGPFQYQYAE
jgi:hypothetical protein